MTPPDVRLQIAAITLAEELNFTRAAERLGITQPALSKQIGEFEARMGLAIFDRKHKGVELTDAGQVLIRGCRDALSMLEKAMRLAKSAHDQIEPVVSVGHSPYADPCLVSALVGVHLPLYPGLRLRVESMFALELTHSVLGGELDLAIIADPAENPSLTLVPIGKAPLYIALPADHPAAGRAVVSVSDLSGLGWMIFPRRAHPAIYDRVLEVGRQARVTPVEIHHYLASHEAVQLLLENFGVAFVSKGLASQMKNENIVTRPLCHESLHVTNYLALRADESSRLINEFGRALLKRILPKQILAENHEQLLLSL